MFYSNINILKYNKSILNNAQIFDPTKTDPTIIAINWVDQILTEKLKTLSHQEIENIKIDINKKTFLLIIKIKKLLLAIIVQEEIFFLIIVIYRISIFLSSIMKIRYVQLLENLIREFELSDNQIEEKGCKYISACSKAYKIYKFPFEKHKQLSDICAKILMRHRGENTQLLPLDQWIRYIERELKSQQCYNV